MKGSLKVIASLTLTLALMLGSVATVAAATPSPSPSPTKAGTRATSPGPSPSPSAAPKTKPRAAAPTHATPAQPQTINKALAKSLATRTAPTTILPGPAACGTGTTVNVNLYAAAGSKAISSTDVAGYNYWGFNTVDAPGLAPGDPGTTLYMCQNDTLAITLYNKLPSPPFGVKGDQHLAIELPALNGHPDTVGLANDGAAHALPAITGLAPGTYLYEAGPTPGGDRQVAMGLAGLLIVRPTGFGGFVNGSSAYGNVLSQFADEYTLSMTELSTEFGDNPFTNDLHEFNPNLFLVNGQPFDPAVPNLLPVAPNDRVLLHQANLGLRDHSMTIAGHRQSLLAQDSHQLTNPLASDFNTDVTTSWLTPGQVTDSFVTVDPKAQSGFKYPVYDAAFHFNNDAAGGLGGMLAELNVVTGVGGVPTGPATTNVVVAPATNPGQTNLADPTSGQIIVTGSVGPSAVRAEWFIDNVGISGSGCDGATHATRCITINPDFTFSLTISWTDFVAALAIDNPLGGTDGDHVFWVHSEDATGLWGVAAGDVQTVAVSGPAIFNLDLHNSPTNGKNPNDIDGSGNLVIWAGAMSSLPDWNVLGAYACVDSCANGHYDLFTNPPPTGPVYNNAYSPAGNFADLQPLGVAYPPQDPACTPQATPGPAGGLGPPPTQPGGANVVSICGIIPSAALLALMPPAFSTHHITVFAYEGRNFNGGPSVNTVPAGWGVRTGGAAEQDIVIDGQGPTTTLLPLAPNNGFQNGAGNLGFLDSLRVTAKIDDSASGNSAISNAELFLTPTPVPPGSPAGTQTRCDGSTAPADTLTGQGAFLFPAGGAWTAGPVADAYAYVPLAEIQACQEGIVTFWVHGQDAAGNWGPFTSVNMVLDKTPPTLSVLTINTVAGVSSLTATANDPSSHGVNNNIVGGEWFTGADPGLGNGLPVVSNSAPPPIFLAGNPVTFTFTPGAGHYAVPTVVSVRVVDAAGNWSAVRTVTVP